MTTFPAAQYLRMSTEHQRFSLANQRLAIEAFAYQHGYNVIQTYEDPGRSGLTLKGRPGLQQLIADVRSGCVAFRTILVLDVSRWGRFQDVDQAAYYEYMCREAGVAVLYCAEAFPNDGSPIASVMKHMKRVMAAEYSRELSMKVSRAQRHQAGLGFKQGGAIALGFRRQVVDEAGRDRFVLANGQHKAFRGDRVIFIRGPKAEVAIVNRIFTLYADEGMRLGAIANWLNKNRKRHPSNGSWTSDSVRHVLTNELYIGRYVFGRTYNNLGKKVPAPEASHVRVEVVTPLVPLDLFERAQVRLDETTRRYYSDEELIERMTRLLRECGRLSFNLVDACSYLPKPVTLRKRFGSLKEAYRLAGYQLPDRWRKKADGVRYSDEDLLEELRRIHCAWGYLSIKAIDGDGKSPKARYFARRFGSLSTAFRLAGFEPLSSSFRKDTINRLREFADDGASGRSRKRNHNADGSLVGEAQLLDMLRTIWRERGYISVALINGDSRFPTAGYFHKRFNGILNAYARIGYASTQSQLVSDAFKRRGSAAQFCGDSRQDHTHISRVDLEGSTDG